MLPIKQSTVTKQNTISHVSDTPFDAIGPPLYAWNWPLVVVTRLGSAYPAKFKSVWRLVNESHNSYKPGYALAVGVAYDFSWCSLRMKAVRCQYYSFIIIHSDHDMLNANILRQHCNDLCGTLGGHPLPSFSLIHLLAMFSKKLFLLAVMLLCWIQVFGSTWPPSIRASACFVAMQLVFRSLK